MFPILAPALVPSMRSEPATDRHLDTLDFLLQDERRFELRGGLPTLQHKQHVSVSLRDVAQSLVSVARRFTDEWPRLHFYETDGVVVVIELLVSGALHTVFFEHLHAKGAVKLPFAAFHRSTTNGHAVLTRGVHIVEVSRIVCEHDKVGPGERWLEIRHFRNKPLADEFILIVTREKPTHVMPVPLGAQDEI